MAASSDTPLAGPDLTAGIPAHTLVDGQLLLGHAHGEPVVLARSAGRVYAIGATCTHYGGPLAEGLLVGETVRCPWHHACFSLRTGAAVAAPAFDPVAYFRIEERDGTIVVGERMMPPASDVGAVGSMPSSVVIVGAGAAGVAAADRLRRDGYQGPLHLIDACDTLPVDRPNLSKDYLAGSAPEEWVFLRPAEYYAEHNIELVLGARVTRVDTATRVVETSDGRSFAFDRLLLATGATPVRLPIPGSDLPHVHYLRSLADSRAIVSAATHASRAVVIGASFIGLEVAASLRARGVDVHVVAPEVRPLERVLGKELGDMIRSAHEAHGVVFHLEQAVARIEATSVTLSDGGMLPAELVVVGVGVRPETELAEQAGLHVDKGVVVDQYLETSLPGIFAAGDIARWPDSRSDRLVRIEHWVVAERQGQTAARNMLGHYEAFTDVPFFWSRHYEFSVDYVGHAEQWERIDVDGDPGTHDCAVTYRAADRILAVATVGRERANLEAELRLERQGGPSDDVG